MGNRPGFPWGLEKDELASSLYAHAGVELPQSGLLSPGMPGTVAFDEPDRAVPDMGAAFSFLDSGLSRMDDRLQLLFTRLQPLLFTEDPGAEQDRPGLGRSSPMVTGVVDRARLVNKQADQVEWLIQHLTL